MEEDSRVRVRGRDKRVYLDGGGLERAAELVVHDRVVRYLVASVDGLLDRVGVRELEDRRPRRPREAGVDPRELWHRVAVDQVVPLLEKADVVELGARALVVRTRGGLGVHVVRELLRCAGLWRFHRVDARGESDVGRAGGVEHLGDLVLVLSLRRETRLLERVQLRPLL